MTSDRRLHGMTLVEVLVATVLLAVGVLAALGLQTSALRTNREARTLQEATRIAAAESTLRHETLSSTGAAQTCRTTVAAGYSCSVDVQPCSFASGAFTCAAIVGQPAANLITITVVGPRGVSVTVPTMRPL
jgi:prepilin-type N-terminal cleavage/methylation domain-containing protein